MANGTIYRTVYNSLDEEISDWVGTNDTPQSGEWSPTNNNGTANMVEVTSYQYDNGGNGEGGGAYVDSGASLAVTDSVFLLNAVLGGDGQHRGSRGEGIGGGVLTLGTFTSDPATFIFLNLASTSGNNIGT